MPQRRLLAPQAPLLAAAAETEELEGETGQEESGHLAKAVLAQSQALTTLVTQLFSANADPLNSRCCGPLSGAKKSAARQISHGARGVLLCCPREHGKENVSSCHSHVRADGAFEPGDWLDPIFREIDLALIARQVAMAMDAVQAGKSELCQDHLALLAVSARWSWHISSRGWRSHPPGCSQIAQ